MPTVSYAYEFSYTYDTRGELFPILQLTVVKPDRSDVAVEIEAYLDSGAQRSLFDGSIARMVGLDLLAGRRLQSSPPLRE